MVKGKNKNRKIYLTVYLFLFIIVLYAANQDLFVFFDSYTINRTFEPQIDPKGSFVSTPPITLKKGEYQIIFDYIGNNRGTGYYVSQNNQLVVQDEFAANSVEEIIEYRVENKPEQIVIGTTYDPAAGIFTLKKISIQSEHVLLRESFIRHAVSTIFFFLLFLLIGWRFFYSTSWYKIWGKYSTPANERILIFLLALAAFSSYPFFFDKAFLRTDDFMFHLLRVEGIKESLLNGIFPARINPVFLNGYGYASGIFYPNVILYFPAIIRTLGFDIVTSYKIFSIVFNLLSIVSIYWVTLKIGKSRYLALIASVFYTFASYRLIDILFRSSLGEAQSFVFIPIIILGLYEIFNEHPERWYLFALGILGLAYSHLLSLAMVIAFIFVFFMLNIKKIISDKKIIGALLKSILFVLTLSAFIWLPIIEQTITNQLKSNILLSSIYFTGSPGNIFLPGAHLFSPIAGWSFTSDANLGLPLLFLPLLLLLLKKSDKSSNQQKAVHFIIWGCSAAFVSTEWFPWRLVAWFGNRLQFSWRFLIIAVPLLSIGGGLITASIIKPRERKMFLIGLLCFCSLSAAPLFYNATVSRFDFTYPYHLETPRVSGGEYLPDGADAGFIDRNKNTVLSNNPDMEITSHKRNFLSFRFEYKTDILIDNQIEFEVPLLYYTGYQATLTPNETEEKIPIKTYRSPHGLIGIEVPNVMQGSIEIHYQKTAMQWISDLISSVSFIFLIGILFWKKKKEKQAL